MPLTIPNLDNRRFDELRSEALVRVSMSTPEWTVLNRSDPGVTLIEVFAFLTESLLYRCNQIPERNRKRFLQLLNIPLQPATAARGLVTIDNEKSSLAPFTFNSGIEIRAGQVPFRTTRGLQVLPVEVRLFAKERLLTPSAEMLQYYRELYSSYRSTNAPLNTQLYQVTPFPVRGGPPLNLSDTIDGCVWAAILVRANDRPADVFVEAARDAIAERTLSFGVVPNLASGGATLPAGRVGGAPNPVTLQAEAPSLPPDGGLLDSDGRIPRYRLLEGSQTADLFRDPGVLDVRLPPKSGLYLWNNIDPLESGVNGLPPALDDTVLNERLITWLRLRPSAATEAQFLWMGANCVPVSQRTRVTGEALPDGTGEPDQVANLSHAPVLSGTVSVSVLTADGTANTWTEIEDLSIAGPEVAVPDDRMPPGGAPDISGPTAVFVLDAESGQIRFGDGLRGARPPEFSLLRADYDFSVGSAGNLGPDALTTSPVLRSGFRVTNPVSTWGGADAETVAEGEKQISRYLQHRDRLVTSADFKTITERTPGVAIGRVEVLPTFQPALEGTLAGDAAGAVTLMIIPSFDAAQPDAPMPNQEFLNTVCSWLDKRRLVTTEVFLRGPRYVGIWISLGIEVVAGMSDAPVRDAVRDAVLAFLAPLKKKGENLPEDPAVLLSAPEAARGLRGWPLGKSVIALELAAVASRVAGVQLVRQPVLLAEDTSPAATATVPMSGLQLPRVLGIRVSSGDPVSLDAVRGLNAGSGADIGAGGTGATGDLVQVPVIPEECR